MIRAISFMLSDEINDSSLEYREQESNKPTYMAIIIHKMSNTYLKRYSKQEENPANSFNDEMLRIDDFSPPCDTD